jgi:hypothetical protein
MHLKMAVFWDVALCDVVDSDHYFSGAYSLHYQGMSKLCVHGNAGVVVRGLCLVQSTPVSTPTFLCAAYSSP